MLIYEVVILMETLKNQHTTANGLEIENPTEQLSATDYREILNNEFDINGQSPAERIEQLKQLSIEGVAVFLEKINHLVQGSETSLMNHDRTMKIGETATLAPEDRYDVFVDLINDIKAAPDNTPPERIADTLALGVVMLHPFHDGNGRTARLIGLTFRGDYDDPDSYENNFNIVTEPRDQARERGGFMINGYAPILPEGASQSNPKDVSNYLKDVIQSKDSGKYIGVFAE